MTFLNYLLVFVPVSIFLEYSHANPIWIFVTAAAAIIPLAGLMGKATEEIAMYAGPRLGGLLNGTFGNAVELIITIFAIKAGLFEMVKASITGSIIGNILLVLGLSIFIGGVKHKEQSFNPTAAGMNSASLFLAVIGLVIPAVFMYSVHIEHGLPARYLSVGVAIVLMITYVLSLVFSLHTHKDILAACSLGQEHGEESACWSKSKAITVLVLATCVVALESEFLVSSVEHVVTSFGLSELFIGVIIIPIIGNAAEHSSAVLMAMKNRMDISLEIAVGSSIQIALFVAPILVFISMAFGNTMDLIFKPFELAAIGFSVLIATLISLDGKSNWLEGVQLLGAYIIMALAFYFIPAL